MHFHVTHLLKLVLTRMKKNSQIHNIHALSCNSPPEENSQTHNKHALSRNSPPEVSVDKNEQK